MEMMGLVFVAVVSRIVPHLPNLTAMGAVAVVSGAKLSLRRALAVTLLSMLISDGIEGFHPVMWATYTGMAIAVLLGTSLRKSGLGRSSVAITVVSSAVFFLLTNFAVWLVPGGMYAKTPAGLIECYTMAVPFFRNSLIGDFLYGVMLFGAYDAVKAIGSTYGRVRS